MSKEQYEKIYKESNYGDTNTGRCPALDYLPYFKKWLKGFVVGAFNIVDLASMEAVIVEAIEKSSPVIIQTSQKTVQEMGFEMLPRLARSLSGNTSVPIAMNLDHGTDIEIVKKCL